MRVFCLFFSIYILLLSLAPCGEMTAKADRRVGETLGQTQFQSGETDENGDDCSPFCICSCCHFSTAYQFKAFSITNKLIIFTVSTAKVSYQNPYAKTYKTSVWQPPKFDSIG